MTETSARFGLPFILPGQAQKEMFHNEAVAAVDSILHPAVETSPAADPPLAPSVGESWIVADGATGAWAGKAASLATWTAGGWRHAQPVEGMLVWNKAAGLWMRWTGTQWSAGILPASAIHIGGQQVVGARLAEVATPSGGTVIDQQARAAIAALIATLKSHGLTE
jgi:hypothetical protein